MASDPIVLVVTGPVGAGKTSAAWALGDLLTERAEAGAVIDVDGLRAVWPQDPADPFAENLGRANLAAVWPNYLRRGIRWLVLADVVEQQSQRELYQQAMPGARIVIVRLDTPLDLIRQRLLARETEASIGWHLDRSEELQTIMVDRRIGDIVIEVADRSPAEVAASILAEVDRRRTDHDHRDRHRPRRGQPRRDM